MRALAIAAAITLTACQQTPAPPASVIRFRDVSQESGLRFTHSNGAQGQFYMPEIMGAGAALLDYDADGDLDVFLVQSAGGSNRLFRNDAMRFTDVTAEAGLEHMAYGMGAATGDFNNDGRIDLLVTNFGANVLYANRGNGRFEDVTAQSPAVRKAGTWSSSASFFDYDRDGWQDLVILSYVDFTIKGNKKCFAPSGEPDYCTPVMYRPVAAQLFHNVKGRFVDVTAASGIDRVKGPGLGVQAIDANADGWPDLFVANDTAANHLWINQKNGTFVESAMAMGTAYGEEGLAKAGMGVAAADYDLDGHDDLVVLNLMREGATLFKGESNGYRDVSMAARIHALTFAFTGFGVGWIDADNDGWPDLFLANGAVTQREDQRGQPSPFRERNLLLRNQGPGKPFADVTGEAGEAMSLAEVTRGAAFGDVNNDGRVDILITNNNGPARLLINESTPAPWLQVAVDAPGLGIGARVGVERDGAPAIWQRIHTDGSYASASSPILHFGLGPFAAKGLVVEWPDGTRTRQPLSKISRRVILRTRNME